MKKTTKVKRDIKVTDIFELGFVKKAAAELNAAELFLQQRPGDGVGHDSLGEGQRRTAPRQTGMR